MPGSRRSASAPRASPTLCSLATGHERRSDGTLPTQFNDALSAIEVNGKKRDRVIAGHKEIRELLEGDEQLCELGVDTILIGSYARHTGIYPGKDVDVFVKLTKLDTSANPADHPSTRARLPRRRLGAQATEGAREAQTGIHHVAVPRDSDGMLLAELRAVSRQLPTKPKQID